MALFDRFTTRELIVSALADGIDPSPTGLARITRRTPASVAAMMSKLRKLGAVDHLGRLVDARAAMPRPGGRPRKPKAVEDEREMLASSFFGFRGSVRDIRWLIKFIVTSTARGRRSDLIDAMKAFKSIEREAREAARSIAEDLETLDDDSWIPCPSGGVVRHGGSRPI